MRHLVVTRGAMGAGKSTFIKNNGLEQYTISPDSIRLMIQSPIMNEYGGLSISTQNERRVWELLFSILEERMKRGEFTIVDACHSKPSDFTKYKELAKEYRYRFSCIDFTDVPIEVCKAQNKQRDSYKHVPEERIDVLYERFKGDGVPNSVKVFKPHEYNELAQYTAKDFSNYKKIHHFGDIHGCYNALMEYFHKADYNVEKYQVNDSLFGFPKLKEDELYIFVGDLCDRGTNNVEVLIFMNHIKDNKNVIILEGNHERHLWSWANGKEATRHFENHTRPELEKAVEKGMLSKSDVRQLYRRLNQVVLYTYGKNKYVVTHGGISHLPDNLMYVATEQLINGVGSYETDIDEIFYNSTDSNVYQIHGHRNIQRFPTMVNERCFNLEGQVEKGGHLRVVVVSDEGREVVEIKNDTIHPMFIKDESYKEVDKNMILNMVDDDYVKKQNLGDGIVSFNFTRKAFTKKKWNENTLKARGLFFNVNTNEIVSRSYDKFFNVNEREETKINNLADNLTFPVTVYLKENGYLGLVGYNSEFDELFISTKSTNNGCHVDWFKELFYKTLKKSEWNEADVKQYLKDNNSTLVFEVIDIFNDPHIIEYNESKIVLLDIVKRTEEYSKESFEEICSVANALSTENKVIETTFNNWNDFYKWYTEIMRDKGILEEGFVIEDSAGFMFKIKLSYYSFWKHMRGIKDVMSNKNPVFNKSSLFNAAAVSFYNWLKEKDKEYIKSSDIIRLRNDYFAESENIG